MELLALLVVGAIVGGGVLWQKHVVEREPSPWQGLAEACGLVDVRPVKRFSHDLTGRLGPLEVALGSYSSGQYQSSTLMVVRGLSRFVGLNREGLGTRVEKALGERDVEIGDDAFDRALYVQGDQRLLPALLDAETRRLLLEAFSGGLGGEDARDRFALRLAGGSLEARFCERLGEEPVPRTETVRTLLDLARRLVEPPDVLARLAANAHSDPLPSVRRNVLRTLERWSPQEPATRAAMERAARQDPDGATRLQAALWLGADGVPTLEELAGNPAVEDAISARAIEALGARLPLDAGGRLLEESLSSARVLTASAAALALGRGGEAQVAVLELALPRAAGAATAAVARALGETGSPRAEAPLLAALAREGEGLPAAVMGALGRVGTAASVMPLTERAATLRGKARQAALDALARVRERLAGVEPGRISLAAGERGQLAIAEDGRGRVDLACPDDSQ